MNYNQPPEALRALVIGAGSAGLLMGQVFKKAGIGATIFEQDQSPTARPRDWSFGIYWAQSRIEACLPPELSVLVDTVQTDPSFRRHEGSFMPVYNGLTGEPLKKIPAPHAMRLRRRAWLDLLRTGLDVRFSKKLVSISTSDDGVTAVFEDGSAETGSLLIGAEGAHSVTRTWLFQHSPQDAALMEVPISSFVTLTKLNRDVALALKAIEKSSCIAVSPGLFTFFSGYDCTSEDPAEWVFMIILTWPVDDAETQAALTKDSTSHRLLERARERTKGLVYPFDTMVRNIPEDTRAWYSKRMTYWPTKPWDNRGGRVTLVGDAAHAMTFHRGQGLGNAIADVAELQVHLRAMKAHTREELAQAVGKYEKDVWKRGYEIVMENLENTISLHDWEKVSESHLVASGLNTDPALHLGKRK
ncbi:uncharacterized protein B0T15DRAFT_213945 [Chaetomium strumarium]|uniref:FAD-binding domain-containing protein n=1 Tax=Chaetomium strumarium TaxID=1170767 RepID=A0AAJ0M1Y1_9PEZI|nr:hypothetical protein B0T15DRAFT_213945 [Chaetomium strumarium]